MDDPHNARREDIIKFFEHIATRQTSHGVNDAFRFKKFLDGRKNGKLMSPKYPDQVLPESSEPEPETGIDQVPEMFTHTFQTNTHAQTYRPETATTLNPEPEPALTYDPNFYWGRHENLDPSLDPSFLFSSNSFLSPTTGPGPASFLTPTPSPAAPSPAASPTGPDPASFLTPTPTSTHQITPRRKGRNADTLAIEEAASLLSPNPSPRRSERNANSLTKRSARR